MFIRKGELNMNSTGFVRRIYPNGSIVIPKEIRKKLKVEEGDPFEFFLGEKGEIILKPYIPEEASVD